MNDSFTDLWTEFKSCDKAEPAVINETGNDVILGQKLNEAVRDVANGYLRKLEFPEHGETKATDERARLLDLHWGRIEQDAAMLEGLGGAIDVLASALEGGARALGESWKGESYDAFKVAIDKICSTLRAYAYGAHSTGLGLKTAMGQARKLYEDYAQNSVNSYLNFSEFTVSPPDEWRKVTDNGDRFSGFALAESCVIELHDCPKKEDEQRAIITDHFVTERSWRICETDPCMSSNDRVADMYKAMVDRCDDGRKGIKGQLEEFFDKTNDLINSITEMMDLAVGNLDELASAEVFTSLRVIASGEPMLPLPEPPPPSSAAEPQAETVEIKDGAHTISVTSPDGDGRVTVTVDSGTGTPKKYELDFGAASGLSPETESPATDVEQVPARTDGKCVIQDGDLTITAERPLFAPESVTITVDNGDGSPTTHTLDFPEPDEPAAPAAHVPDSQVTTTQAWIDESGSLSGVLVPEQADGEAELPSASDAPEPAATGMVGAGLRGTHGGRVGSGWSVHGDLFDSAEPVYSMHGVLGDDEQDAER